MYEMFASSLGWYSLAVDDYYLSSGGSRFFRQGEATEGQRNSIGGELPSFAETKNV